MPIDKYITNDDLNVVEKVFSLVSIQKYEQAYNTLIEYENNTKINTMLKDWVHALCNYHVFNKKIEAIKILEVIKPEKIKGDMDFRIWHSLFGFYLDIEDNKKFYELKDFIEENIDKVTITNLKVRAFYNISNGYFTFEKYNKALIYADKSIDEARKGNYIDKVFFYVIYIKIVSLYKLGQYQSSIDAIELYNQYKSLIYYIPEELDPNIQRINQLLKKKLKK